MRVEAISVGVLIIAALGMAWLTGWSAYNLYRGHP
jgi:hypothetical protein